MASWKDHNNKQIWIIIVISYSMPQREDRGASMLQSMGSQRVGHNLVTEQQQPQCPALQIQLYVSVGNDKPSDNIKQQQYVHT